MTSWMNLMDIIYPVNSIYLSASNVSPADIIGGSWRRLENALLACAGEDYGSVLAETGDNVISVDQMPSHRHKIPFGRDDWSETTPINYNTVSFDRYTNTGLRVYYAQGSRPSDDTATGGATFYTKTYFNLCLGACCLTKKVIDNVLD